MSVATQLRLLGSAGFVPLFAAALHAAEPCRCFDFGEGPVASGWTQVGTQTRFTPEQGFGLEPGSTPRSSILATADPLQGDALLAESKPFLFSVVLPEGNYRVEVLLGDPLGSSDTSIKAESRRLMIEHALTAPGQLRTVDFLVNIRTPELVPPPKNAPGLSRVLLNDRELKVLHWDNKLTLEFNGPRASVAGVKICPASGPEVHSVFLIGDSTVTDQPGEPAAGWGQMLPRFFGPQIAVANHAESGETLKSFLMEGRLAKVLEQIKAGDFLFIQFGHNDSKTQWPQTYAEANTTYAAYLRAVIAEARLRGAQPVLVTSMHRRKFDQAGKVVDTHGTYPDAVRAVAAAENVPLIDLHTLSAGFYEQLGPKGSAVAFVDGTHHSNYGGYELAKLIVVELRKQVPALAADLREDAPQVFEADAPQAWSMPASPTRLTEAPRGN